MIILDPGHGIDTLGKRSPLWTDMPQLFEWEFTRDIARRIHKSLVNTNICCEILVQEDTDMPLAVRVKKANKLYSENKNSFLISIHGNAGEKPNQGKGWEVWTSPGDTESDRIATRLFLSAKTHLSGFVLRSDYLDDDPDKESKFYILVHTRCPAVLTENLFYDNKKECKFMMSEEGRILISQLHVDAIRKYIL